jgi:hypothetical protein
MMATQQEKDELIQALRFTPRDITISVWGYGGEIVMGTVTAEQYNFWQGREDFEDAVWDFDHELPPGASEDLRFCHAGEWHDCDDIAHECSVELSDHCCISVRDDSTDEVIWQSDLGVATLHEHGVQVDWSQCIERSDHEGRYMFIGQSMEKGSFGSRCVKISEPFDPKKLKITGNDIDGWCLLGGIEYDGDEGTDVGDYDTTGKGSAFQLHYEPESGHHLSDWHDAVATYPAHDGVYDIETPDTVRRAWWVNRAWREQDGQEISGVERWRGLAKFQG